jgi:hypothetical protein
MILLVTDVDCPDRLEEVLLDRTAGELPGDAVYFLTVVEERLPSVRLGFRIARGVVLPVGTLLVVALRDLMVRAAVLFPTARPPSRVGALTRLNDIRFAFTLRTRDLSRTEEARLATALSRLAMWRTPGCLESREILPSLRTLAWLRAAWEIRLDCSWFLWTTVSAREL